MSDPLSLGRAHTSQYYDQRFGGIGLLFSNLESHYSFIRYQGAIAFIDLSTSSDRSLGGQKRKVGRGKKVLLCIRM